MSFVYGLPIEFYIVSQLINFLTSLGLGFFVIYKSPGSKVNRTFAFFCFSVAQWSLFFLIWLSVDSKALAEFFLRSCMLGVIFMPSVFTHFVTRFLNKKPNSTMTAFNYSISCLIAATVYTPLFARNFEEFLIFYWGEAGVIFPVHLLHFFLNIIYSHYLMAKGIKHERGVKRKQIAYIFTGTAIGYFAGAFNYFAWYRVPVPPVLNVLISVYVLMITYAIVRYRLMDIRIMAIRTLGFVLVYIPLLSLPFFAGHRLAIEGPWGLPVILATVLAPGALFLYLYVQNRAERGIRSKKLKYLRALHDLLETVKRIRTLDELTELVLKKITDLIGVRYAAFYLSEEKSQDFILKQMICEGGAGAPELPVSIERDNVLVRCLERGGATLVREELGLIRDMEGTPDLEELAHVLGRMGACVVIPAFYQDHLPAFIILGQSIKQQTYDEYDIEAFNMLGLNTGLAVKNALFVKDINTAHSNLLAAERLAAIGRLATSAKHEINNPLNVVYGSFQQAILDLKAKKGCFKDPVLRIGKILMELECIAREKLPEEKRLLRLFETSTKKARSVSENSNSCGGEDMFACTTELEESVKEIISIARCLGPSGEEIVARSGTVLKILAKIRDFDEQLEENLSKGFISAQRISQAVNAMYHLPKELELEASEIDVGDLISSSLEFAGYQSYWENLSDTRLELDIPEDLPGVKGHFNRLVTVFSNLVINAYQAMTLSERNTKSERVIRIGAELCSERAGYVDIFVGNSGDTIPDGDLDRIFKQGYSTKGSAGVGLDIARTQVEVFHSGKIFARNVPSFGPELVVRLPLWADGSVSEC